MLTRISISTILQSKQEANVRMIRRHAIQQANMVGKDNRKGNMINNGLDFYRDKSDIRDSDTSPPAGELMPDPLLTVGFINIRIRPPLHSRGIRRMTFPAEITITVCSPVNTEPQLADYKTLCEHFMAMDSHFITASVELPLANKLAKEIIVRATREEFISKYGLVSLRWDENSLKRDNNAGSILASSSYDETANRQQDISPRLRSASESNREDVQIGVAKLWATKPDIMKIALDRLCKAEGIIISVSIGDKTHSDAFDSGGSSSGAISLSDILPASSATGKFRINPGKISPVQSPLLGINSRTVSLSNDYCDVSNQTQKSTCPLEIAYESTLAAEIVNSPDSDRSKSFSGVPPGFLPFTPPHNDFNFFPESSVVRPSAPLDTMSASSSLSPDSEPMSYLLSRLGEDQGFREVNAELGGFNVKQRVSGPPKFAYSRYPSGSEHETPSQPISRSNSTTKSIFGYGYGMETAPKFSLLAASNEQLPLDIKAAPGLNIPTDWDHLFEKADYRTSPSGTIPRTVAGSNSSRNMLSNSDFDQFSPKYNIKQAFSYDGFNAMPFSSQSPISAFAPFARDRAYSMTSIQKENSNSRDSSDLLPTGSIWNENLLRDSGQSFAPIRDTDIRFGSGSSIFNDGITSGRRMSLDLGEIAGDRSRLTGNSSFESTPRLSARQGHSEQLPQSYQQIHHEQFQARQQQVTTTPVENRLVVHWPHPSLRFMFLGDPLKYQLSDLLHKLRARGVGISTPFRDKTNASACLVIEGNSSNPLQIYG